MTKELHVARGVRILNQHADDDLGPRRLLLTKDIPLMRKVCHTDSTLHIPC